VWAEGNQPQAGVEDIVIDTMSWGTGKFMVLDSVQIPESVTPVAIDIQQLQQEARRRRESYKPDDILRVVDDPAVQQHVSLSAGEFKVLFKIGSGRAVADLQKEIAAEELIPVLQKLRKVGLITVSPSTAPVQKVDDDATVAQPGKREREARNTLVGSLTPDMNPDQSYPLLEPEYTIGRAPENAITIPDGSVSSKHARIVRGESGFVLEDLQSRNGTFVNGEKVTDPRALSDGDILRLGKVLLTFNVASENTASPTTQPEVRLL
ncbi:MAG: hypothetical protein QOH21_379, partial [Acidobacteriota bacterium]|nr:hypothetical protein [Acidobacteriota bacterium]